MAVFLNMKKEDLKKLEPLGFSHIETKTQYELARLTGPCTAILYSSGKLLLQGKNDEIRKVVDFLVIGGYSDFIENKVKETLDNDPIKVRGTIIGTDETLKGDTFGGLVVGGFLGDRKIGKKLNSMGVKDSKRIEDREIIYIAKEIMKKFPKNYFIRIISPKEYNLFMGKSNITTLLNFLHEECHKKLFDKDAVHVVDKFPGATVGDILETKAESKYIEVAAASILARYAGLEQLKTLELYADFIIPKGSTHVRGALLKLKKNKRLDPADFVKLHFSNVRAIFG